MTGEEAEQLKVGTLLRVREDMLDDTPPNDALALRKVVEQDGYIYRFAKWLPDEEFPVQVKALATGNDTEFYPEEVEAIEEQD